MDCGQSLSLPKDIAWERLAFSPDMFDTNFKDPGLPPKWRTSLAAFYYVVPEEETKDIYPDRRIMYLRVIASITGCNLSAEAFPSNKSVQDQLKDWKKFKPDIDAFQTSSLEVLRGKLAYYFPCEGAILQVAVHPHSEDNVGSDLWRYPYIQDFEPKKREIYETVSKSGEVLSGSSSALNLKKGTTTTESLEESDISSHSAEVGASGGWGPFSASAKYGYKTEHATKKHTGKEESHLTSTDSTREKRETQSYTTSINQMYQPLLSYHLGTNRALWAISPRPHTADSEFNLISIYPGQRKYTKEGTLIGRKLEGIQDVFLVVNMPKDSKGLCFQASLDTGYDYGISKSECNLVVMRRAVQSCGKFDQGNFKIDYFPGRFAWAYERHPYVVNEIRNIHPGVLIQAKDLNNIEKKTELILKANERSKYITQGMLDGYSSKVYEPRPFVETDTFNAVVESSLKESTFKISELEFLMKEEELLEQLRGRRIETVGDLMSTEYESDPVVQPVRERILDSTAAIGKEIAKYQREQYEKQQREKK